MKKSIITRMGVAKLILYITAASMARKIVVPPEIKERIQAVWVKTENINKFAEKGYLFVSRSPSFHKGLYLIFLKENNYENN